MGTASSVLNQSVLDFLFPVMKSELVALSSLCLVCMIEKLCTCSRGY